MFPTQGMPNIEYAANQNIKAMAAQLSRSCAGNGTLFRVWNRG
jgi:hypothetical protein